MSATDLLVEQCEFEILTVGVRLKAPKPVPISVIDTPADNGAFTVPKYNFKYDLDKT